MASHSVTTEFRSAGTHMSEWMLAANGVAPEHNVEAHDPGFGVDGRMSLMWVWAKSSMLNFLGMLIPWGLPRVWVMGVIPSFGADRNAVLRDAHRRAGQQHPLETQGRAEPSTSWSET